jgi:putative solute:sodium symporter small subunit
MATESNSQDQRAADPQRIERDRAYWRANLRLMAVLLSLWFITSFGFGILLVDWLNRFQFFGFPLGFWWAQQGSIYVFIVLIFVYAAAMRRLDRQYDVDEDRT